MPELDDLLDVEDLDEDQPDDDDTIRKIRNRNRQMAKELKRLKQVESDHAKLRQDTAIGQIGKELNERQVKALLATHEGDMTTEALRATAAELGFIEADDAEPVPPEDLDAEEQVNKAVAGSSSPNTAGLITPADASSWGVDKQIRFKKQHPDAFEALKRGESVKVPTFT